MGFLTKYGTIWGQIPQTAGRVFWVAPGAGGYVVDGNTYSASDDNDGLSPERAFATSDRGINLADQNGDVVVLLPGAHTSTASLAMDTAGVTLTGLPGGKGNYKRPKTSLISGSGEAINVTAANCEIAYLEIIALTVLSSVDISAAGHGTYVHDCKFEMTTAAVNTGTIGIECLGACQEVLIENCFFVSDGAQGNAILATASVSMEITDCLFEVTTSSWAVGILIGAATAGCLIRRCAFIASTAGIFAVPIDGTGSTLAGSVSVQDCRFPVSMTGITLPFGDGVFAAGEIEMVENYVADVGGGAGGTLAALIT